MFEQSVNDMILQLKLQVAMQNDKGKRKLSQHASNPKDTLSLFHPHQTKFHLH